MKVVLAGTPSIATPIFQQIINSFEVVGVITQPDKFAGRGQSVKKFSPVKQMALDKGLRVLQPIKVNDAYTNISKLGADVLLVVAYGQYIPQKILKLFPLGAINVHFSLLPLHRGASPVTNTILKGDEITGVSLMQVTTEMDAGPVLFQITSPVGNQTALDLAKALSFLAATKIVGWLNKYLLGNYKEKPQDPNRATFCKKISRSDTFINPTDPVTLGVRKVRAFYGGVGARVLMRNCEYKIFAVSTTPTNDGIPFKMLDGYLYIQEIQPPNRRRMGAKAFRNGYLNG